MTHHERRWAALTIGLFACDRVFKMIAASGAAREIAGNGLRFELFKNAGIAFSLPFSGPFVWLISIGILAAVSVMAARDVQSRVYSRIGAYGLFVFGACSNLFDRVVYGYTIDYLIIASRSAVNLADGMIIAGALWLLLQTPRAKTRREN